MEFQDLDWTTDAERLARSDSLSHTDSVSGRADKEAQEGLADTTVLVVDDERSNLDSLEKIFQREGARVLTAGSGREALDLCRQHNVDVVLTDLMMPGMSGIDLVRALDTVAPDAEVVLMTAYGTIETAVEAMREGAYDFVEKPLKRVHIVKTVKKAAERHRLVAENRTLKQELSALKTPIDRRQLARAPARARHRRRRRRRRPRRCSCSARAEPARS